MRTILLTLLVLASTLAAAEPRMASKKVLCDSTQAIFKTVVEDFEETPQWRGQGTQQATTVVLTVNRATGTWTLIEYREEWACVIAVGEGSSTKQGSGI